MKYLPLQEEEVFRTRLTWVSGVALVFGFLALLISIFNISLTLNYRFEQIRSLSLKIDELEAMVNQSSHNLVKRDVKRNVKRGIAAEEDQRQDMEEQLNEMSLGDLLNLQGPPGKDGRDGEDGKDGKDCDLLVQMWQELKESNSKSSDGMADFLGAVNQTFGMQLKDVVGQIAGLENQFTNISDLNQNSGSTYVRWGRTTCPERSQLIYEGFAAGQFYDHTGGSAEKVCLPLDPEYSSYSVNHDKGNWIYGAEYEIYTDISATNIFPTNLDQQNVPCATCYSGGRSTMLMIPAKRNCPDQTWTKEYEGYLMTERYIHKSSALYSCVDAEAEAIEGWHGSQDGALFYFVQASCEHTGHCPQYIDGAELTCVVCTK